MLFVYRTASHNALRQIETETSLIGVVCLRHQPFWRRKLVQLKQFTRVKHVVPKEPPEKKQSAPRRDYLDSFNNRTGLQNPQNINRTGPNKKRIEVQKPKNINRGGAIIWNSRVEK